MSEPFIDTLLDFGAKRLDAAKQTLPGKTLLETLQGKKGPITEKDFSPQHQKVVKDLTAIAQAQSRNFVTYDDYATLASSYNTPSPNKGKPDSNIVEEVRTTLGMFNYARDQKGTRVTDTYDFESKGRGDWADKPYQSFIDHGLYGLIRSYASRKIPPGKGRPVILQIK